MLETLSQIALRYGSDKGPHVHNYTRHYERYFAPLREQPITLLEIGVAGGASLRTWQEYFPRARVIGIDVVPIPALGERIQVFLGSQADPGFLLALAQQLGPFDVIIDDGSHIGDDQRLSFETLYAYVKPGGLYIIEDLHTAYWGWGNSFVEYLKSRMDVVLYPGQSPIGDPRNHPNRAEIVARMDRLARETMTIHLHSSLIVFEKFPEGEEHR